MAMVPKLNTTIFEKEIPFKVVAPFEPMGDQPQAIADLAGGIENGMAAQVLLGATGTGKTVVAAFDYRRLCAAQGGRPRLLFVAHREEILRQARRTYQEVLRDHAFGCLLVGGAEPDSHDHLFATIDSVSSRRLVDRFGADYWNVVVIDECHRLAANRFDTLANAIRPAVLLGLTATPERSDGKSILGYFRTVGMVRRLSSFDFGRHWICSCCVRSNTTLATMRRISLRCPGARREKRPPSTGS